MNKISTDFDIKLVDHEKKLMQNIETVLNNFENKIRSQTEPADKVVLKKVTNVSKKPESFGNEFDEVAGLLNDDIKYLR